MASARQAVVRKARWAHRSLVEGLKGRRLQITEGKDTITSTHQEVTDELAESFPSAEAATVVKKLGIDFSLAMGRPFPAMHGCRNPFKRPRFEQGVGGAKVRNL